MSDWKQRLTRDLEPVLRETDPRAQFSAYHNLPYAKAAIASVADGASKADVVAATGLSDGGWNKVVSALLDRGDVTRSG
jgi:hypothetical protein